MGLYRPLSPVILFHSFWRNFRYIIQLSEFAGLGPSNPGTVERKEHELVMGKCTFHGMVVAVIKYQASRALRAPGEGGFVRFGLCA
jgi:hypothetical protein